MKKALMMIGILIITSGCTCEYNLKIENNTYSEEVILIATTTSEKEEFNRAWKVPIDKDTYNIGLDTEETGSDNDEYYDNKIVGNRLIFSHDFNKSDYSKSSAVSNCYNSLSISNSSDKIIISTSKEVKCLDDYPNLTELKINITTNNPVKTHNADSISGNTYTWNINKNNANNKSINLILVNENNSVSNTTTTVASNNTITPDKPRKDYSMYIFSAILLAVMLTVYAIYNKRKNKEEKI